MRDRVVLLVRRDGLVLGAEALTRGAEIVVVHERGEDGSAQEKEARFRGPEVRLRGDEEK